MEYFRPIMAFALGTITGSFANVCIHRIPRQRSTVTPSSRCPLCQAPIPAWDNIPLISYILLGGKCRSCGGAISLRYPAVEAVNGIVYLGLYLEMGLTPQALVYAAFSTSLVILSFIDLEFYIIPHKITLPGIGAGLLAGWLLLPPGLLGSLIGAAAGAGFFFSVAFLALLILKREGMGGGDVALAVMIGAFLGWRGLVVAVMIAMVSGSMIGVALLMAGRMKRRDPLPFGPFLALGALIATLWGDAIVDWYAGLYYPG